ncbi:MAG: DUF3159 domain-containing protein [Jatrophihabitans sp.]|nr:MAG: DUF3159 domain-containing protein [Jatrophihabitans sp.]
MSASTGPDAPDRAAAMRETYRTQMINSIGGWSGTVVTAVPPVVFVIVNALAGLRPAILAAIASGLALAVYRIARKQPIQQAVSGLFAVLIAALIAARTGQARGYFLFGIWTSFAYAVPFAASVLVRRPLVGLVWEFLDPSPAGPGVPWYRRRVLRRAYDLATLAATVVFLARGLVQWQLYGDNATGWLAFARVAMGYPLWIAAVGFAFLVVTRARRQLAEPADHRPAALAPAPPGAADSAADGAPDR